MRITYLYHDGFLADLGNCQIIFDYWKMHPGCSESLEDMLDGSKPLYVFVSHFHKDHYNPGVFELSGREAGVRYVVSGDVARRARHFYRAGSTYRGSRKVSEDQVTVMREGEIFEDGCLKVRAFGSTDTGCSWLVEAGGKKLFHAGDLNAWIWKEESTEEEVACAIDDFRSKIRPMKDVTDKIDVAMFPVDSRIGPEYYTGARIFVREFDVKFFIPMHFGLGETADESARYIRDATRFEMYANEGRGVYLSLTGPYSSILLPD